jgi:hypothetical protein
MAPNQMSKEVFVQEPTAKRHAAATPSPAEIVAAIEAPSVVRTTPCGDGHMVWHQWGRGRTVVLFHGGHGSWTHWLRNIEALSARYRVLAADLPGLGDSATPPLPHNPDTLSDIVAGGLRTLLAPGEQADLVGFSFGGMDRRARRGEAWLADPQPDPGGGGRHGAAAARPARHAGLARRSRPGPARGHPPP